MLIVIMLAIVSAFIVSICFIRFAFVSGESMYPTLKDKQLVVVDRRAYSGDSKPKYGDIVLIHKPDVTKKDIVKRVVAVPGETVEIKDGILYTNGKIKNDKYSYPNDKDDFGPLTVKENSYFVLGDNRDNSTDSRFFNDPFVKTNEIKGKVTYLLFPKLQNVK